MLGPFWLILAPFGLPQGSQGRLPNLAPFLVPFWCPFWLHFGAILAPKTNIFRVKNCIDFLIDFWSHFGSILDAFLEPFRFQNRARIEKGDFVKMSVSPARGAHFQRFGPPKSIQKSVKNQSKHRLVFWSKKVAKNDQKWLPKCLPKPPKTLPKTTPRKRRKKNQKNNPQKPVSVREREARFISQTSRTSPSLWLYRSARCEASLSGHPYSSIAALARLRSRAALAKRRWDALGLARIR